MERGPLLRAQKEKKGGLVLAPPSKISSKEVVLRHLEIFHTMRTALSWRFAYIPHFRENREKVAQWLLDCSKKMAHIEKSHQMAPFEPLQSLHAIADDLSHLHRGACSEKAYAMALALDYVIPLLLFLSLFKDGHPIKHRYTCPFIINYTLMLYIFLHLFHIMGRVYWSISYVNWFALKNLPKLEWVDRLRILLLPLFPSFSDVRALNFSMIFPFLLMDGWLIHCYLARRYTASKFTINALIEQGQGMLLAIEKKKNHLFALQNLLSQPPNHLPQDVMGELFCFLEEKEVVEEVFQQKKPHIKEACPQK